jgi:predicted ATP-dependent endonuclease of OLD family
MLIKRIEFDNFRSFGPHHQILDFNPNLTFFVGKNNTGKSNLVKFFLELKLNRSPLNRQYVLQKANWYNYEAGVEKPLKFKFTLQLSDAEYRQICMDWFVKPIFHAYAYVEPIRREKFIIRTGIVDFAKELDYDLWKPVLRKWFPQMDLIFRVEYLRFSDTEQHINYSIEFNQFMALSTADGRVFVQNLRQSDPNKKIKEKDPWDLALFSRLESFGPPDTKSRDHMLMEICQDTKKYLFDQESIDRYIERILNSIEISDQNRIIDAITTQKNVEPDQLEKIILNQLYSLYQRALMELFATPESLSPNYLLKPTISQAWQKYAFLVDIFESLYEDMDLTFGVVNRHGQPTIRYFQRSTNLVIYNFDSIGSGITEMLYFLYKLVVEKDRFFIFEEPEAHLHPHHQRTIYNIIREHAQQHQVVVITHSLFFFQPDDLFSLRIFDYIQGTTRISRLHPTLSAKDYDLLRKNFTVRNRDAIFADGIIFVEGVSEEWTFPYFFKSFGLDMDMNNLSLINIGGKGSFAAFLTFAQQLQKKYWFFFDYDVLGLKAGEEITPKIFKSSVIYKNRSFYPPDILQLCESIIWDATYANLSTIEFHEKLEYLRHLLQQIHIFIFSEDFEGMFEASLGSRIRFGGGKMDKAIQLLDFMKEHEEEQFLPDQLFEYIEIIRDDLKKS